MHSKTNYIPFTKFINVTIIELAIWLSVRVCGNQLLERLMSPKSQVMFASPFSWSGDFFRIFGINSFFKFLSTFYTPGAYALTHSQAMQRSRAVHACGALRLVGGCTRRYNNVGGVTAGQAPHNSTNVGVVTASQVGHNSCVDSVH